MRIRSAITFITSNRTREVHDALKRRCLYQWVDFPDEEQELAILTGAIEMMVGAMNRGRATARDFSRADFLGMLDWRLDDVREEFGVAPL